MTDTTIYWANSEDKSRAYRLRYEVEVEGQGFFFAEADHQRRWLSDSDDENARILLAREGGRVVGTMRLRWGHESHFTQISREDYGIQQFAPVVDSNAIAIVDRLALSSESSYVTHFVDLFCQTAVFAEQHGIELVVVFCQAHAVGHYQLLGFRPYGSLHHHPHYGLMVPMALVVGDFKHFRTLSSPLYKALMNAGSEPVVLPERKHTITRLGKLIERNRPVTSEFDCANFLQRVVASFTRPSRDLTAELQRQYRPSSRSLLDKILRDPEAGNILLQYSHILECQHGDVLFRRGEQLGAVYILLEGSVSVGRNGYSTNHIDYSGGLVGEATFLTRNPSAFDAVADAGGAKVLALNLGVLNRMFKHHDALAAQFLQYISTEQLSTQMAVELAPARQHRLNPLAVQAA